MKDIDLSPYHLNHPKRHETYIVLGALGLLELRGIPIIDACLTGSAFCTTVENPGDLDVAILVSDGAAAGRSMQNLGWEDCAGFHYEPAPGEPVWGAYRHGPVNVIFTDDPLWYTHRWVKPSYQLLEQDLHRKEDRVALFSEGGAAYKRVKENEHA